MRVLNPAGGLDAISNSAFPAGPSKIAPSMSFVPDAQSLERVIANSRSRIDLQGDFVASLAGFGFVVGFLAGFVGFLSGFAGDFGWPAPLSARLIIL